jgi:hypothetical protein
MIANKTWAPGHTATSRWNIRLKTETMPSRVSSISTEAEERRAFGKCGLRPIWRAIFSAGQRISQVAMNRTFRQSRTKAGEQKSRAFWFSIIKWIPIT